MIPSTALRFLAAQQGLLGPGPAPDAWELGGMTFDVVEPTVRHAGTILSVHGMTPHGPRDERLVHFHGALAACGYRVVAPVLPSVARLRMHAGQIDRIERAIRLVADHRGLTPSGRVSVFAPSFSGGLSLIAAARGSVADQVRAVLVLGAYGNIRSTMDTLLTQPGFNPYAWKIVFANFLDVVHGQRTGVRDALITAAIDEWHLDEPPKLPGFLQELPDDERALAETLMREPEARRALWQDILRAGPPFLTYGSVVDQLEGLKAHVTLLHGANDPTIPARQSAEVHRALQELGHPSRLLITPALGHGGTTDPWALAQGVPKLVSAFEGFFGRARADHDARIPLRATLMRASV